MAGIKPILHGDNGASLKATTVLAMLHWLGIAPSYSRPRVNDCNDFIESLFRTAKYRPGYSADGFDNLHAARETAAENDALHIRPLTHHPGDPQGAINDSTQQSIVREVLPDTPRVLSKIEDRVSGARNRLSTIGQGLSIIQGLRSASHQSECCRCCKVDDVHDRVGKLAA